MNNCLWMLQAIIAIEILFPFIMFFVERRIHKGVVSDIWRCPMIYGAAISSVVALGLSVGHYPSPYWIIMSIFIFGAMYMVSVAASVAMGVNID